LVVIGRNRFAFRIAKANSKNVPFAGFWLDRRPAPCSSLNQPNRRARESDHLDVSMTCSVIGEYSSPEFRARCTQQARRAAELSDAIIAVSRHTFTAAQVSNG